MTTHDLISKTYWNVNLFYIVGVKYCQLCWILLIQLTFYKYRVQNCYFHFIKYKMYAHSWLFWFNSPPFKIFQTFETIQNQNLSGLFMFFNFSFGLRQIPMNLVINLPTKNDLLHFTSSIKKSTSFICNRKCLHYFLVIYIWPFKFQSWEKWKIFFSSTCHKIRKIYFELQGFI